MRSAIPRQDGNVKLLPNCYIPGVSAPLVVGSLNHFTPKFRLGVLFGPNEVQKNASRTISTPSKCIGATTKNLMGQSILEQKHNNNKMIHSPTFLLFQWCWRNFEIISPTIQLKEEQWVKGFLLQLFSWGCWNSGWREERALWGLITLWEWGQGQRLFNSILRFQNLPP